MSLVIFIVILSIMIIVHEFGHLIVAKRLGMKVEKFSLGFGKRVISFKKNDTEYALSLVPFGGYVKISGFSENECVGKTDEFLSRSVFQRILVIFCGPFVNYIFAFLCFWLIFILGFPRLTSTVGSVVDNFPAQQVGVLAQDKLIEIEGKQIGYWDELEEAIHNTEKSSLKIKVQRQGKTMEFSIPVKKEEMNDVFGKKHSLKVIGIRSSEEFTQIKYGFLSAGGAAFTRLIDLTKLTYSGIWWLVTGKISFKDSVTGPIGIYDMTKNVVKLGFVAVLQLMAVLSLSLALFNLLPFPVLDGGHIFLLLIEKLRSKRLSQKIEDAINNVGFSFIILIGIFVVYNDLVRLGHIEKITSFFQSIVK
jgi:regulator of sigma E protease